MLERSIPGASVMIIAHVLQVTKNAIEIGQKISEKVHPFILICGALFHQQTFYFLGELRKAPTERRVEVGKIPLPRGS